VHSYLTALRGEIGDLQVTWSGRVELAELSEERWSELAEWCDLRLGELTRMRLFAEQQREKLR